MKNMPIYEALAQAFAAEGVDTHFTLMGDGNMHWATAMKNLDGMSSVFARHEHCACAMAMGYHLATGKVGVASVTCGPGFTQIMTALAGAAQGHVPLVVFAGEIADQRQMVQPGDRPAAVRRRRRRALHLRAQPAAHVSIRPRGVPHRAAQPQAVVIGVPYDLQKQPLPEHGRLSAVDRGDAEGGADPPASASGRATGGQACQREVPDRRCRTRRGALRAPRPRSSNWPIRPARCWRPRCRRAACSTTILIRSASPAAMPATSPANSARRPISWSPSGRA